MRDLSDNLLVFSVHGFSPEEIVYGASRSKCSVPEFVSSMIDAGVGSLPGTSAEILDDDVRNVLAPNRLSTEQWLSVVRAAHRQGLRTTSTVMFGHCESYTELAAHLCLIREVQRETGGFTEVCDSLLMSHKFVNLGQHVAEFLWISIDFDRILQFVPLSFISSEAPLYREQQQKISEGGTASAAGERILRSGATHRERLLTHAVSRIVLHGYIENIQGSWVKEGLDRMKELISYCGVNDVGGTLMNESISTAAGSSHGQMMRPSTLRATIADAGRTPVERSTLYETLRRFDTADDLSTAEPSGSTWQELQVGRLQSLEQLEERDAAEVFGSFGSMISSHPPEHNYRQQFAPDRPGAGGQRRGQRGQRSTKSMHTAVVHTAGLSSERKVVTYSPSHTIIPMYLLWRIASTKLINFRAVFNQAPVCIDTVDDVMALFQPLVVHSPSFGPDL